MAKVAVFGGEGMGGADSRCLRWWQLAPQTLARLSEMSDDFLHPWPGMLLYKTSDSLTLSKFYSAIIGRALPLVPKYGFTRTCLAVASAATPGEAPLSDIALTALFGEESGARSILINAWLDRGLQGIRKPSAELIDPASPSQLHATLKNTLTRRLDYNKPVISLLPEARIQNVGNDDER